MSVITPDTGGAIVVSDANSIDRVTLGQLADAAGIPTGEYGLKVVSSDGETIIIDGTSNMFKIVATGTTTVNVPVDTTASVDVTLTALGTFATTPAHTSFVADDFVTTTQQYGYTFIIPEAGFAATTSGGAVTNAVDTLGAVVVISTRLNGSSFCVVRIQGWNRNAGPDWDYYGRYYILKEAAL